MYCKNCRERGRRRTYCYRQTMMITSRGTKYSLIWWGEASTAYYLGSALTKWAHQTRKYTKREWITVQTAVHWRVFVVKCSKNVIFLPILPRIAYRNDDITVVYHKLLATFLSATFLTQLRLDNNITAGCQHHLCRVSTNNFLWS